MNDVDAIFEPVPEVERALAQVIGSVRAGLKQIAAMEYAVLGGGKRLRPLLCWRACEAMGGRGEDSLRAGVSLELIHCFSLVHDDLPALDNDDLRRGKPTLHRHAGEAMAILAGDALLTLAFEHLVEDRQHKLDPALCVALLRELSVATNHMIHGQVCDTLGDLPGGLTDEDRLVRIHAGKTGALLLAACRMGGMIGLGTVDESALLPLSAYAKAIGILFQAVDDLLDVTQSSEHAGKRTNKDASAGKLTFPALYGVEGTREHIDRYLAEALGAIAPLEFCRRVELERIANFLARRTK